MNPIYLDHNATTPIAPAVQEAMLPYFTEYYGNPSSGHVSGRICQEAMEDARGRISSCIGAEREEIYFTSGGTESSNLAILGAMQVDHGGTNATGRFSSQSRPHLVVSAIEHPATMAPAEHLRELGYDVTIVSCDRHGIVSPPSVEAALREETRLVSIMHANNEIGTVQPIAEIGDICRARNILFHTDAAQSLGKIRVLVQELNVDLLTIAGHKLYAPKGIGALYVRKGVVLNQILFGAGHEKGLRPGTENVPYIVGLGKACELIHHSLDEKADRMASLRDMLVDRLKQEIGAELIVHGFQAERLPNTVSIAFPKVRGHELLDRAKEVCASTGSACHAASRSISTTLAAMKVDEQVAAGTVRMSVGWGTTEDEIERAVSLLVDAWESLR